MPKKQVRGVIRPAGFYVDGQVGGSGPDGKGHKAQGWVFLTLDINVGDLENPIIEPREFVFKAEEARTLGLWLMERAAATMAGADIGNHFLSEGMAPLDVKKFFEALANADHARNRVEPEKAVIND